MTEPEAGSVPVSESLFTWPGEPRLIGTRCADCGTVTFPGQQSCSRCTGTALRATPLATRGHLWTWTIQAFEPKPPYAADGPFRPYGVGYVELAAEDGDGTVLVESRLTEADPGHLEIGAEMKLVLVPFRRDASGKQVLTFAFEPVSHRPE